MTRRISIRSYRKPDTLYSPLDLVVCEGETEVDYLCELARSLRIHVHICKGDGTDSKSIVNTGKRKSKEDGIKYDKIYCVFDRDNDLSGFLEAIELCKSKKFVPIVSNPCFELWPYLHFQARESGFGSPQQMLKALKKLPGFENYNKDGVQIFNTTFHLIDIASKRSSSLVSKQHDEPKEDPLQIFIYSSKDFRFLRKSKTTLDSRRDHMKLRVMTKLDLLNVAKVHKETFQDSTQK